MVYFIQYFPAISKSCQLYQAFPCWKGQIRHSFHTHPRCCEMHSQRPLWIEQQGGRVGCTQLLIWMPYVSRLPVKSHHNIRTISYCNGDKIINWISGQEASLVKINSPVRKLSQQFQHLSFLTYGRIGKKNSNTAPRERSLLNLFFVKATTFQLLKKEQKTTTKTPICHI